VPNIPFIKIIKKTDSKVEQIKVVIKIFCLLSGIKLSDTEVTTLAFFVVYGLTEKTKSFIIQSKILKSFSSLKNTITKLRKNSLLIKNDIEEDIINPQINITPNETVGVFIKIDGK
jgi:hypothetical protein